MDAGDLIRGARRAIQLETAALLAFAVTAGLVVAVLGGIWISRTASSVRRVVAGAARARVHPAQRGAARRRAPGARHGARCARRRRRCHAAVGPLPDRPRPRDRALARPQRQPCRPGDRVDGDRRARRVAVTARGTPRRAPCDERGTGHRGASLERRPAADRVDRRAVGRRRAHRRRQPGGDGGFDVRDAGRGRSADVRSRSATRRD